MPLEIIGRRLQSVVNVERAHLARPARGAGREQRGRIGAAAEADRQRQRRREGGDGLVEGPAHWSTLALRAFPPSGSEPSFGRPCECLMAQLCLARVLANLDPMEKPVRCPATILFM